jgi:lipopolysaccharide transport system ATP-binding protein
MDIAISVKNLSKSFRMYPSPKDKLKELLHPFGKKYHQEFWALKDISYDIKKGECVGIIGKNGSGKSTLLQIICGVLQPTSGEAKVKGRISALLELGAGFNRAFTGRENVYMNGALMGFSQEEMDEKFHAIAEFADIGEFIDQPVKTYSSGMYVRLAFACAVNIDPDILIVDEALSVGDEAFQRKCFSRILDFQKRGKTILFVSHTATVIVELCNRAILFDQGELLLIGPPKPVVARYQKFIYAPADKLLLLREDIRALQGSISDQVQDAARTALNELKGSKDPAQEGKTRRNAFYDPHLVPKSTIFYESHGAFIRDPCITSLKGEKVNNLIRGEQYIYTYIVDFREDAYNVHFGMLIKTVTGLELGGMVSHPHTAPIEFIPKGTTKKQSFVFRCALVPGAYFLNAGVFGTVNGSGTYLHRLIDAAMFKVQPEENLCTTGTVDFTSI